MNFQEYINQTNPIRQEIGSVIVSKKDIFKVIYKTQRHPFTDKKYTHIYICLKFDNNIFTYDYTSTGVLKNPKNFNLSVFRLSDELIKYFKECTRQ